MSEVVEYLTKWYTIIGAALLIYGISRIITVQLFIRKHGCKETACLLESGFFSFGYLRIMLKLKREGELVDFIREVFNRQGLQTLYLRLCGVRVICTQEPENVKAMLATQFSDFALGTRHAHFEPLLGDGIFTLDGEGWKHSRAMLRPQFARDQIAHVKALEPHLQTLGKHIEKANGQTFDIQDLFFKFTVDTSSEFLFGESVHSLWDASIGSPPHDFEGKEGFAEAFNITQHYLATRSYTQMFYFLINNKEFRDNCKAVHRFASYYVNKALDTPQEELEEKSKDGYIFLYELVKQTRNRKVLQDQLLNIMVAGRDTTAGLLSFTFFELARNPDVFKKLREEIVSQFGTGTEEDVENISFENLKKCEYLKWVLNEVLRLYPSVPVNFRVATKDTTLPRGGGKDAMSPVFVGKGTTVAYSVYSTHRLEEYYGKDSTEFVPERWANPKKLGWAYLPFNGGPRICLGQQFALTEASYVVVRLLQMFSKIELKDDRPYPPKKCVHLTMSHFDGVHIQLT